MEVKFFPWLHRSLEFKNRLQLFLDPVYQICEINCPDQKE
jgi:hypothetical protein